tara:strand:+ start:155 stop:1969 length:1815 start_codon:yes stop_codon:yes gene_type:complete
LEKGYEKIGTIIIFGIPHHRHKVCSLSRALSSKDNKKTIIIMPLVDITNDIKRSIKKQQQQHTTQQQQQKLKKQQHKIDVVESPSHLREISVERRKEDDDDDAPPTRGKSRRSSGVRSNNTSSSPFSKVSVEGPGEFLDSEPSLSAKSSSSSDDATISSKTKSALTKENEAQQQQQQNQPQLRQSRRQKHQPQRLGDLLEWNDIKSNALYEKYDPEREQRLLEQVQMEKEKLRRIEEEEKNKNTTGTTAASHNRRTSGGKKKLGGGASGTRTSASHGASAACESSCYRSGQQSEAVLEVHQRVADLMKMAEQMLPPEEEEEVDDGLPKKSIREKLRDAWDGEGYYAKLMKEQDGPSSSSSSSSSGNRNAAVTPVSASAASNTTSNSGKKASTSKSNKNNNNSKKEGGLKVYCDKENPVAHKVNRAKKANDGGLGSASSSGKLAPVGCGNNAAAPLVQRTALASALGNVTNANASSSSSTSNTINNTTISSAYMFGNLKTIQAPHASSTHSVSSNSERSTSPPPSSSASASRNDSNETLLALKAENDLLRKQRNDVKLQHLKLKKELDDLKKNARIAVSKLCAKLPNNSRGVELDALAFLKLTPQ